MLIDLTLKFYLDAISHTNCQKWEKKETTALHLFILKVHLLDTSLTGSSG